MIPVASKQEIQQFKHKFHTMSRQSMTDEHVWLSVFTRPPRSRFNRVERLSCCMVILTISMVVGAMWYEKEPSKPMTGMKFGPFSLSMEEVIFNYIKLKYFHLRQFRITHCTWLVLDFCSC